MVPSRAGARAGHSTRRHARERGGAVACRSIDPTFDSPPPRVRGCDLRDRIARPRARAVRRMGRRANLIVSRAIDRVVANQIIGPRARADILFIFIFMAEYFIWRFTYEIFGVLLPGTTIETARETPLESLHYP